MRTFSFGWLLAPVGPAVFFEQHWETAPMLVKRDEPAYFADLPGLDAVDELIAATVSNRVRPADSERGETQNRSGALRDALGSRTSGDAAFFLEDDWNISDAGGSDEVFFLPPEDDAGTN
jgi:hypothetical protein